MVGFAPRPPLLPWSPATWSVRWSAQGRLSGVPVPRTPFLLLKAPVSTLYEEKFGGDRNMFTVGMYCSRMAARSVRVGLVVDCTALDLEEFEPLPAAKASAAATKFDRRVRYFHNPSEWDDYDVEYHRLDPPKSSSNGGADDAPLAPRALPDFYRAVSDFLNKSRSSMSTNNSIKTYIALFDSRGGLGAAAYLAASYMCHTLRAPVHAAIEALKEGTPPQPGEDPDKKWGLRDVRLAKDLQTRFRGRKEIKFEGGTPGWWWAMEEEDAEDDDDEDAGKFDHIEGEESTAMRKRSREEAIIIPPCDSSVEDDRFKRARNSGDSATSGNVLYPSLPKDILEPVPKDSLRWNRALTVLAQLTKVISSASTSTVPTAMTSLPLKPEVNVSQGNTGKDILQLIKSNPDKYKVTWLSTKGRRGLLLILAEAVYFIEESTTSPSIISIFIVTNIKFPTPKDLAKIHHRTLLDVVLVKDIERNKSTFRFYALDILCIEGGMVWHKPWDHRWRFLNEGVLVPRKKDGLRPTPHSYANEPIKLRAKEYFPMKKLGFVMKDVCAGVGHEAEGVWVVPTSGGYGVGENKNESTISVVWRRRGSGIDDERLKSLLLADN